MQVVYLSLIHLAIPPIDPTKTTLSTVPAFLSRIWGNTSMRALHRTKRIGLELRDIILDAATSVNTVIKRCRNAFAHSLTPQLFLFRCIPHFRYDVDGAILLQYLRESDNDTGLRSGDTWTVRPRARFCKCINTGNAATDGSDRSIASCENGAYPHTSYRAAYSEKPYYILRPSCSSHTVFDQFAIRELSWIGDVLNRTIGLGEI